MTGDVRSTKTSPLAGLRARYPHPIVNQCFMPYVSAIPRPGPPDHRASRPTRLAASQPLSLYHPDRCPNLPSPAFTRNLRLALASRIELSNHQRYDGDGSIRGQVRRHGTQGVLCRIDGLQSGARINDRSDRTHRWQPQPIVLCQSAFAFGRCHRGVRDGFNVQGGLRSTLALVVDRSLGRSITPPSQAPTKRTARPILRTSGLPKNERVKG